MRTVHHTHHIAEPPHVAARIAVATASVRDRCHRALSQGHAELKSPRVTGVLAIVTINKLFGAGKYVILRPQPKNLVAEHAILPEQPQTLLFSGHPSRQETLNTIYWVNDHSGLSDACVWAALRQAQSLSRACRWGERMCAWLTMDGCPASRGALTTTYLVDDHQGHTPSIRPHPSKSTNTERPGIDTACLRHSSPTSISSSARRSLRPLHDGTRPLTTPIPQEGTPC